MAIIDIIKSYTSSFNAAETSQRVLKVSNSGVVHVNAASAISSKRFNQQIDAASRVVSNSRDYEKNREAKKQA